MDPEKNRRLIEPFCGGLAVTLSFGPASAVLNDINPHLINFYKWLQRGLTIDFAMANDERSYYRLRTRFNDLLKHGREETSEAAGLFYYLNRTGYNGLCRFNRSGAFNVPFGRYKQIKYKRDFSEYVAILGRYQFTSQEFDTLPLLPDDFVYADPPYDVVFRQYSRGGFGWEAQVRTAEWLTSHPGPVVLSNQATEQIVRLYRKLGYKLTEVEAPRRISCTGDRTPAIEVLATRNIRP